MRCSALALAAFAVTAVTASNGGLDARQNDAQSSKTLLDDQIQTVTNAGTPEAGQVNSAVSTNNFINFCATKSGQPLTNGLQTKTGSCNPIPMGVILATDRLPSAKFTSPKNLGVVKANANFTISLKIKNLSTGFFTNPATTYFAAPSDTNSDGFLIAHSHVTVDKISSIDSTEVGDALNFAFFKGLNGKADQNGVLSTVVAGGLAEGDYRLCSINTAANHQPVLGSVAQHASFDDCIYFSVTADGSDPAADTGKVAAAGTKANTSGKTGTKGAAVKAGNAKSNVSNAAGNFVDTNETSDSNNGDTAPQTASEAARGRATRLRRRAAHQRRAAELERMRRQRMSA